MKLDYSDHIKSKNYSLYKPKIIDNRLEKIYEDLRLLVESEYDWEGYGLEKPKQSTKTKTESFLLSFLDILDEAGYTWVDPLRIVRDQIQFFTYVGIIFPNTDRSIDV